MYQSISSVLMYTDYLCTCGPTHTHRNMGMYYYHAFLLQRQVFQLAAAGMHSTTALPPGPNLASPAQFYCRRDHTVGGVSSILDRIRTHHDLPYMESFTEVQEGGSG